jgi:DNA-binding beta-propeller fold protein YncE
VTVVELRDHRVFDPVSVGGKPSGGAVLPGDREYAVAVRGEDRIAFVSTVSRKVVGSLKEGIGQAPFSVVLSRDGRLAFVNNTASHDVSVLLLPERRVVARIPVGEIPIVMAVHPSGETLWVSPEGSHEVSVIEIPKRWRFPP